MFIIARLHNDKQLVAYLFLCVGQREKKTSSQALRLKMFACNDNKRYLPNSQKFWSFARCCARWFNKQTLNVSQRQNSGSNHPRQTNYGANTNADSYDSKIQMITSTFLKWKKLTSPGQDHFESKLFAAKVLISRYETSNLVLYYSRDAWTW